MKIYKYYKGKVYSIEVRETRDMYIYDGAAGISGLAFGYRERFHKVACAKTHIEAIENELEEQANLLDLLKRQKHTVESEIGQINKTRKSFIAGRNNAVYLD